MTNYSASSAVLLKQQASISNVYFPLLIWRQKSQNRKV